LRAWLAEEEQIADPMARLRAPKVSEKLVPVFTSEELSALQETCQGRTFAQRRHTGLGELAGIRYDARDPRRSDLDLWSREITVRGKARNGWSRSGMRLPGPWTATCGSGPGTRRRGGRSCGWG
jgi:integrase